MKKALGKILAIALSISTLVSIAPVVSSYAEDTSTALTATKTAKWTNENRTTMNIAIDESKIATTQGTPKILFLGTLCGAHSLTDSTLFKALTATAQYGDVDCYLYGNGWTGGTIERKYHAEINKIDSAVYTTDAQKENYVKNTTATFEENETGTTSTATIGSIQLIEGQHNCVYDFAELISKNTANKGINDKEYDYIVFEFDGLRMGHTSYAPDNTDKTNLVSASEWIAPYYANNKIAWIIPDKNHKETGSTTISDGSEKTENTYMYNEYFFDEIKGDYKSTRPVRDCIWLLAPEDVSTTEKTNKTITGTLTEQTNFIKRASDTSDTGIWVTYDDAEKVKVFLKNKLASYYVKIEDIVNPGFTVTSVKGQFSTDGTTWSDIETEGAFTCVPSPWTKETTGTELKGIFNLSLIYPNYGAGNTHYVRMLISCSLDKTNPSNSSYIFKSSNNYTVNTNVGNATVTDIECTEQNTESVASPTLSRPAKYTIEYVLNGGSLGKDNEDKNITNPTVYFSDSDAITLNNPTKNGYTFKGWTGGVISGSTDPKDVEDKTTVTIPTGSTGNRKYVANWEPMFTISKTATEEVAVGGTIKYTINVKNNTANTVNKVYVTDSFPANIINIKNIKTAGITYDNEKKWWRIDSIDAGQTVTISFTATANETAGNTIKNTAYVAAYSIDGNTTKKINDKYRPNAEATTLVKEAVNVSYQFVNSPEGLEIQPPETDTIIKGSQYTSASKAGIRMRGYSFDGWYTTKECTEKFTDNSQVDGNKTLYGKWTKKDNPLSAKKEAEWTDKPDKTKLDITITEKKNQDAEDTPRILFLGTLCDAHSLERDAVVKALEASSKYGEVEYYLYKRKYDDTGDSALAASGTLEKNAESTKIEEIVTTSGNLETGYHASLYDFAGILKDANTSKYDFIVMEFDGMRLGHFKSTEGTYPTETDKANLNAAANKMIQFYEAGKVAWIIPDVTIPSFKTKAGNEKENVNNTYIYNDYFFDNDDVVNQMKGAKENVRETIKLLAPENLDNNGDVQGELKDQSKLRERCQDTSDKKIWVYYNNADQVRIFLDKKLGNQVEISDVVVPGFSVDSVKGQYLKKDESGNLTSEWVTIPTTQAEGKYKRVKDASWTSIPKTGTDETALSYSFEEKADGTTEVIGNFNLSKIYANYVYGDSNSVRLIISSTLNPNEISSTYYTYDATKKIYTLKTNTDTVTEPAENGYVATIKEKGGGIESSIKKPTATVEKEAVEVSYSYVTTTVPSGKKAPKSDTLIKGTKYNATTEETVKGYTFSGWYLDNKLSNDKQYPSEGQKINADTPLYGEWTENDVTIKYQVVGPTGCGSVSSASETVKAVTGTAAGSTPTANAGYTFVGWYDNEACEGTALTAGEKDKYTPSKNTDEVYESKTYYAKFTANTNTKYKIEYYLENANDDGYTKYQVESKDYVKEKTGTTGETAKVDESSGDTSDVISIEHFTYDSGNTNNVKEGTIAGDGTLVLKLYYKRNTHNVSYEYTNSPAPSGATDITKDAYVTTSYKYGQTVNVAADASATGYTFGGWKKGDASAGTSFAMPDNDVVLKGSFTEKTLTLNYKAKTGGTVKKTATDTGTETVSETIGVVNGTAAGAIATPDTGYEFEGWYTDEDCSSDKKISGATSSYAPTKPTGGYVDGTTYYAKFKEDTVTINYKPVLNGEVSTTGGTVSSDKDADIGVITGTPQGSTPTAKSGYYFVGWYDNRAGTGDKLTEGTGNKFTPTKNTESGKYEANTYYAVFKPLLSISKTATPESNALPGDEVTYTITVKNTGDKTITDTIVHDTLPEGLTVHNWSDNYDNVDHVSGTTYDYKILSLEAGASSSFSYKVKLPEDQSVKKYTNTAKITSFKYGDSTITDFNPEDSATTNLSDNIKVVYHFVNKPYSVDGGTTKDSLLPATAYIPIDTAYTSEKTGRDKKTPIAREGYVFDGWYTDSSCAADKKYVDGTVLKANQDLYGKWTYAISLKKELTSPTDTDKIKAGDELTYRITVTNKSESALDGYKLTDTIDQDLEFVSVTFGGNTHDKADCTSKTLSTDGYEYSVSNSKLSIAKLTIPAKSGNTDGKLEVEIKATVKTTLSGGDDKVKNKAVGTDTKNLEKDGTDNLKNIVRESNEVENAVKLTIKYHYSSGSNTPESKKKLPNDALADFGGTYTAATVEEVPGYHFVGWYTDDNKEHSYDSSKALNKDNFNDLKDGGTVLNLYGKWEYLTVDKQLTSHSDTTEIYGGDTLTYTITVNNSSSKALENYQVKDTFDSDVEFASVTYGSTTWSKDQLKDKTLETDGIEFTNSTLTIGKLTIPAKSGSGDGKYEINVSVKVKDVTTTTEIKNQAIGVDTVNKKKNASEEDVPIETPSNEVTRNASPRKIKIVYNYVNTPSGATKPADVNNQSYGADFKVSDKGSTSDLTHKDWYTFSGWYLTNTSGTLTDAVSGTLALTTTNFGALSSGDTINLYGKWTPVNKFDVSKDVKFDKDGDEKAESVKEQTVLANNTVQYAITIQNENPAEAATIKFVDKLPNGLSNISSITQNGDYSGKEHPENKTNNDTITWSAVSLAKKGDAGDSVTVTFNATIPSDITDNTTYVNNTYVDKVKVGDNDETYDGPGDKDDMQSATITGVPIKTVIVAKSWSDTWENHKDDSVLVYAYKNGTKLDGDDGEITLNYSKQSETRIVAAKDSEGKDISYTFKEVSGTKELSEGDMNGKYKVSYPAVVVTESGTVETNTIQNNYQIQPSDLVAYKAACNEKGETLDKIENNQQYFYVLTVGNNRTYETAQAVIVEDTVPSGLTIDKNGIVKPDADTVAVDGQKITWTITSLEPGSTNIKSIKIPVTVSSGSDAIEFTNVAKVVSIGGTTISDDQKPTTNPVKTRVRNFTVSKKWKDRDGNEITGEAKKNMPAVTVSLYQSKTGVAPAVMSRDDATQVLNSSNNWTYKWKKLPLCDSDGNAYNYTVVEQGMEQYTTGYTYGQATTTSYGNTSGTITNTKRKVNVSYSFVSTDNPKCVNPPTTVAYDYGTSYKAEAAMNADGYTFAGWYLDAACETSYGSAAKNLDEATFASLQNGGTNVTIYGKWTKIEKKIHYEPNGGTGEPGDDTINYFDPANISNVKPTRIGLTFLGWSTDPNATKPDPDFDPEALVKKANTDEGLADLTVYAVWGVNVSYQYVGDVPSLVKIPDSEDLEKGVKYTAASKPTRLGYTFAGWYTDPQCTIAYVDGTEINENTILYGKWTKNPSVILGTGDSNNSLLVSLVGMMSSLLGAVLILRRRKIS